MSLQDVQAALNEIDSITKDGKVTLEEFKMAMASGLGPSFGLESGEPVSSGRATATNISTDELARDLELGRDMVEMECDAKIEAAEKAMAEANASKARRMAAFGGDVGQALPNSLASVSGVDFV